MNRISPELAALKRRYGPIAREYLIAHPLCQATLLEYKIPELAAIATAESRPGGAVVRWKTRRFFIPDAVEIHHRNKRHGERLIDVRWFLAVSTVQHQFIERFKTEARRLGWLLDVSCNPDGCTPGGIQARTTAEMFADLEASWNSEPEVIRVKTP